ncbi:MAG: hypothetical protein LBS18_02280 [Clostridiales bacterium]|jgi:hypothetical protein|nr:hypothetical protein [Clostridiales bacterium]
MDKHPERWIDAPLRETAQKDNAAIPFAAIRETILRRAAQQSNAGVLPFNGVDKESKHGAIRIRGGMPAQNKKRRKTIHALSISLGAAAAVLLAFISVRQGLTGATDTAKDEAPLLAMESMESAAMNTAGQGQDRSEAAAGGAEKGRSENSLETPEMALPAPDAIMDSPMDSGMDAGYGGGAESFGGGTAERATDEAAALTEEERRAIDAIYGALLLPLPGEEEYALATVTYEEYAYCTVYPLDGTGAQGIWINGMRLFLVTPNARAGFSARYAVMPDTYAVLGTVR